MRGWACYFGPSDRVLYGNPLRVGWVGFYDWDLDYPPPMEETAKIAMALGRNILTFKSSDTRGYHLVALDVGNWHHKELFWHELTELMKGRFGEEPDCPMLRDNILRLTAKNGCVPSYLYSAPFARMWASSFHYSAFLHNVPSDRRGVIHAMYPRRVETWGRFKVYPSDPAGAFDLVD